MIRADRIVRNLLRTRFVVTTKQSQTFSGVLLDADDRSLRLSEVEFVSADGTSTKADGQVFIPRADVAYMQQV